ncbi:MAG: AAA family ATPase [Woeseiaceae bacterium]|nr:AAA family ATPase [Woeseiaceae bacterium]
MAIEFASADLIEGLLSPSAYPHEVGEVELVETHISRVFLTGEYAYKIKKPVDFGFLDFTTLAKRRHFCEEEVRLNRSWAPDLYLEVMPITVVGGEPCLGGEGTPIEYAVRMRQFGYDMRLDRQLALGELGVEDVLELAAEIARQHLDAKPVRPSGRLLRVTEQQIRDNYESLAGDVPDTFLSAQRRWIEDKLEDYERVMRERCEQGFFRECHGDLKLANIVRLPEGIRAFDCIEFNRDLREIDVVADYAFLTMDLKVRGAADLASVFLNRYLEITGDYRGACLLPIYEVYRSLVRAKILGIKLRESGIAETAASDRRAMRRYCALARALTMPRHPVLVAMTGYSGSGKSWLSERLVPGLAAIRLRSDLERKRLAGLSPTADSDSGIESGIYDRASTAAVYDRLLETAGELLHAGLNVIVDASFLSASHRRLARRTAVRSGANFALVSTVASETELRKRLERRGKDPSVSEAGIAVLRHQLGSSDPLAVDETGATITVDTEGAIDILKLTSEIEQVGSRASAA